uniref:Uncharacterized protein n=1 Tax=mine drainage metagenome TaxID=410659 RepID=E6PYL7_9ZZZZ
MSGVGGQVSGYLRPLLQGYELVGRGEAVERQAAARAREQSSESKSHLSHPSVSTLGR